MRSHSGQVHAKPRALRGCVTKAKRGTYVAIFITIPSTIHIWNSNSIVEHDTPIQLWRMKMELVYVNWYWQLRIVCCVSYLLAYWKLSSWLWFPCLRWPPSPWWVVCWGLLKFVSQPASRPTLSIVLVTYIYIYNEFITLFTKQLNKINKYHTVSVWVQFLSSV